MGLVCALNLDIWLVGGAVCLVVLLAIRWPWSRQSRVAAPLVGVAKGKFLSGLRSRLGYIQRGYFMIYQAYGEHPDHVFKIPTVNHELLILPPKYVDELKSQPETILSSSHAVTDYFLGTYTTLDIPKFGHTVWEVIRGRLTQQLGNLTAPLSKECVYAFGEEFPTCESWTNVSVHATMLRIVGRLTGRIFVGPQLGRDPKWLDTSIDFATCIFQASSLLKMVPGIIRPLVALFNPHLHRIRKHHKTARKLLIPEIRRRRELSAPKENHDVDPGAPLGDADMLTWLEEVSSGRDLDPQRIIDRQMGMSFAAIHTTSNHLTNVIYDLAARWDQYAEELRAEIQEVMGNSNELNKTQITKLSKLDSFMKESQRWNPPSALSFNRKLMASHMLSDGTILPKNSYIAVASGPLGRSLQYHNSPNVFDGFRFHRRRNDAVADGSTSGSGSHLFATTSLGSLVFGHGRFACPGRFFAGMESKIILVHLLRHYDLKLPDGTMRPANLVFADANFPDPTKGVLFRRRDK